MTLAEHAMRRLRYLSRWRCAEPVLIFESDDWGMDRRLCSDLLRKFGTPGELADEALETPDDLDRLYAALETYRDPNGRAACFVANFVTATPDFEAIIRDGYQRYHDIPLANDAAKPHAKWREGMQRGLFSPQYHARAHFWPDLWLRDLQADAPGARDLAAANCHGSLALLEGQAWRYHSEYLCWQDGRERDPAAALDWLQTGLRYFQDEFGTPSRSTIAPHYIFTPGTRVAWASAGIQMVQGANAIPQRGPDGQMITIGYPTGDQSPEGLLYLSRNVKFDPRPQRPKFNTAWALSQIKGCFGRHVPAVVDTHRINYSGAWADGAARELRSLLAGLQADRPLILTSVELGEALLNKGRYRDGWTGQDRHITPLDSPAQKGLRLALRYYYARHYARVLTRAA